MTKFLTKDEVLGIIEQQRIRNVSWMLERINNALRLHAAETTSSDFAYTLPEGVPDIEIDMLIAKIEEDGEWIAIRNEFTLNIVLK